MDLGLIVWTAALFFILGNLSGRYVIPWLVDHYPLHRVR